MFKWIYFKTDIKKIVREPMMTFLFLVPFGLPIIFKALMIFFIPFMREFIGFDFTSYSIYFLSFILIISPGILGMVVGFMLIDDKDNKIVQLMSITPIGQKGYIFLRLTFVFISTFIYTIYSYFIMGIYIISIGTLLYLTILLSLYGCLISMLLFLFASDKVKGLTYAKALNMMLLFALADLVDVRKIQLFSSLFPTYWITRIIAEPYNINVLFLGGIIHLIWFGIGFFGLKRLY